MSFGAKIGGFLQNNRILRGRACRGANIPLGLPEYFALSNQIQNLKQLLSGSLLKQSKTVQYRGRCPSDGIVVSRDSSLKLIGQFKSGIAKNRRCPHVSGALANIDSPVSTDERI
jgi:hypothetical protein